MFTPQNPFIIPSQVVEIVPFTQKPAPNGINCLMNYALHNVTDLIPLFNKSALDLTVHENPMLQELQFTVGSLKIPDVPCKTVGPRFYAMALANSDLDNVFEPTSEYEDSLSRPFNSDAGIRLINTLQDQTSFLPPFSVERQSDGFFLDGLESGDSEVKIILKGNPIFSGAADTYYYPNNDDPTYVNTTPPELGLCRDTWFSFDFMNGLQYHDTGTPAMYDNPQARILRNAGSELG
jgi:hypothetical protein